MESSLTAPAWALIGRYLEAQVLARAGLKVWIAQPEYSDSFLEVAKSFSTHSLFVYQSFLPQVAQLLRHGVRCTQKLENNLYDLALIVPTRQRTESLGLVAHAMLHLRPGGRLIFCCPNTLGAGGFVSHFEEAFIEIESDSAKKCKLVVLRPEEIRTPEIMLQWQSQAAPQKLSDTPFQSIAGIYGWNKIDHASELLVSTLPPLEGVGADLGSGYGYLTHALLQKSTQISAVHLLEAEHRALECARVNLQNFSRLCRFHWVDVSDSLLVKALSAPDGTALPALDWVVMNPPFHEGSQNKLSLGQSFIESAARLLRPGGTLYMVANSFLAYENTLDKKFQKHVRVLAQDGFKVIHARR